MFDASISSYRAASRAIVVESYSIFAVLELVARYPLVHILSTLYSRRYDNSDASKVNLKQLRDTPLVKQRKYNMHGYRRPSLMPVAVTTADSAGKASSVYGCL